MYKGFPDVNRSLADNSDGILAHDVESGKDSIAALLTESLEESFACLIRALGRSVFFFHLDLAADARDTVQQLTSKSNGRLLQISVARIDCSP